MNVLIVESRHDLGVLWQRHLERLAASVTLVHGQTDAIEHLRDNSPDIIILDLVLEEGSSLTISDFASFRRPDARVIFVTNTSFFSDGSIFAHAQNACAYVQSETPPEDLAAMVEHYASVR
ncbi:response regulator transcription factor [Pseudosulfitobacter sp. SM2401]|jgi:DNA-binding NtrC family response regulator|uniref:response regulator transcription factor n=1 Tax=Pseudosulfitobacter sp. SM2401 TaxID=3350098 RepID=UPI0036F2F3C0